MGAKESSLSILGRRDTRPGLGEAAATWVPARAVRPSAALPAARLCRPGQIGMEALAFGLNVLVLWIV